MAKRLIGLCLMFLALVCSPARSAEVRISAAASLSTAIKEIVTLYRQRHPQPRLLLNFASSGSLAKQIAAGAPADVYISANPEWMRYLQDQGLVAPTAPRILVYNRLVFIGAPDTPAATLNDLPRLTRIALGSPNSVPAGRYAQLALSAAGLYDRLQSASRLVLAKDVRQALLYAERGEVDGAFVYRTDALLARQAGILFSVPQELHPPIAYPAALTGAATGNAAAKSFFAFLFSPPACAILSDFDFLIPES